MFNVKSGQIKIIKYACKKKPEISDKVVSLVRCSRIAFFTKTYVNNLPSCFRVK